MTVWRHDPPPFCELVPGGDRASWRGAADVSTYIHEWIEAQARYGLISTNPYVSCIDYSIAS